MSGKRIKVEVEITEQTCLDIMTNALEGGSMFNWEGFRVVNIDRRPDFDIEAMTVECWNPDRDERMTTTIRWDDVPEAIEDILAGKAKVNDYFMRMIRTAIDPDNADIDADGSDIVMQWIVFGEVVYW